MHAYFAVLTGLVFILERFVRRIVNLASRVEVLEQIRLNSAVSEVFSAGSKWAGKSTKVISVRLGIYWDTENMFFWSVPAMEKSSPAKIWSKIQIAAAPALFLMHLDCT